MVAAAFKSELASKSHQEGKPAWKWGYMRACKEFSAPQIVIKYSPF